MSLQVVPCLPVRSLHGFEKLTSSICAALGLGWRKALRDLDNNKRYGKVLSAL